MSVKHGRVVVTPDQDQPYKVIIEHEGDQFTEHPVQSVREGEDLIRQISGAKAKPDQLREWNPLM
jgi:hypothetical protein